MAWMDEQLGFSEPANPIVTEPVIHLPDWQNDGKKDSVSTEEPPIMQNPQNPQNVRVDFTRLSPTNYFAVNGDRLEIQTDLGGLFALVDLNGSVLFKTRIKTGRTSMRIPAKAMGRHWIATLNGKMLSR